MGIHGSSRNLMGYSCGVTTKYCGVMDGAIYMEYSWAFMGIDGSLQVSADIS